MHLSSCYTIMIHIHFPRIQGALLTSQPNNRSIDLGITPFPPHYPLLSNLVYLPLAEVGKWCPKSPLSKSNSPSDIRPCFSRSYSLPPLLPPLILLLLILLLYMLPVVEEVVEEVGGGVIGSTCRRSSCIRIRLARSVCRWRRVEEPTGVYRGVYTCKVVVLVLLVQYSSMLLLLV